MRKNFFGIFSAIRNRDFESREFEKIAPKVTQFFSAHNSHTVDKFVYSLLVSKFIHLINTKPNYQNCGRLDLAPERDLQYSESEVKAILQLYFNRDDADCSVLFITGHGTPKGEVFLWCKEGEVAISFQLIKDLWDNRTSKSRNRELLLIVDSCFSGHWVSANQQPDIFVQASCANKEKSRDIRAGDNVVGSVFLHNLLMINGVTECFFEGVNQTPTCSYLNNDQAMRVRNVFELDCMKRNWDDFKIVFKDKFRSFSRDSIIWEGPPPAGPQPEVLIHQENVKRAGFGGSHIDRGINQSEILVREKEFGFGTFGGPIGGPIGAPIGGGFGMDIRTGGMTVTTTTTSGGSTVVKEEVLKRSFQGGSSGGMMRFGMN